jgi:hypothetical protein
VSIAQNNWEINQNNIIKHDVLLIFVEKPPKLTTILGAFKLKFRLGLSTGAVK